VITESIPTDSSITASFLNKEQKKSKTQSKKKGTKSVKLSPIEEEILAIQQEMSLNREILSETKDVDKKKTKTQTSKKETKLVEIPSFVEKIKPRIGAYFSMFPSSFTSTSTKCWRPT